jgi:hypothetical protein
MIEILEVSYEDFCELLFLLAPKGLCEACPQALISVAKRKSVIQYLESMIVIDNYSICLFYKDQRIFGFSSIGKIGSIENPFVNIYSASGAALIPLW